MEGWTGRNEALQIQADHFQKNNRRYSKTTTSETTEQLELNERIVGLEDVRNRTLEQKQLEEVRELDELGEGVAPY